ncbi:hypothetical protein FQN55_003973 [Onygenales sp. PD_40]|nr:hypothetical protein FQN55_003973 [Onygenales sp. PD_40]KAK2786981.1 hypothetical protein FQN52_007423 [Onygenales sp. PD_12]
MRLSSAILLLPALAVAQEQAPLKEQVQGWLNKAKSFLPTATPVVAPPAGEPVVPPQRVSKDVEVVNLRLSNWRSLIAPTAEGPAEEWLVYVTGGNTTCFGRCLKADNAFEESIPLFAADETSPSIGKLDCEKQGLLCSIMSAGPPSLWHIQVPARVSGEPKPPTPIHIVGINTTTVNADKFYTTHSEKTWQQRKELESAFHPMDGFLAQYGLNVVIAYVVYYMAMVPSWLMMVGVSFLSRTIMSRRMSPGRPQAAPPAAAQ